MKNSILVSTFLLVGSVAYAADLENAIADINPPEAGTVTSSHGLEAFDRVFEVLTHPRCANCHVGDDNRPRWSGPSYAPFPPGKTWKYHGMNINAGESRIGVETMPCSTCHQTTPDLESEAHAPPHFGLDWRLAPVEFEWFGKSPKEICEQLKDPDRNGDRDWIGLAEHLVLDAGHRGPVLWGWNPGGEREAAPYSLQEHVDDIVTWGVAGQPCPAE